MNIVPVNVKGEIWWLIPGVGLRKDKAAALHIGMSNFDDQTPPALAKKIIDRLTWEKGETVLEPCRGLGAFYNSLPTCVKKDWCEIAEGRDFLDWEGQYQTIITNPPYKDKENGTNLVMAFLFKSMELATKRIVFLLNHQSFNALTPNRLQKFSDGGWSITDLAVHAVKKWFGRYYLITLEKHAKPVVRWDTTN